MGTKRKITRSRNGCHKCKRLKIKCDESKPSCSNCLRTDAECDYSIKLTWGGRPFKDPKKRKQNSAKSAEPQSYEFNFQLDTPNNGKSSFDIASPTLVSQEVYQSEVSTPISPPVTSAKRARLVIEEAQRSSKRSLLNPPSQNNSFLSPTISRESTIPVNVRQDEEVDYTAIEDNLRNSLQEARRYAYHRPEITTSGASPINFEEPQDSNGIHRVPNNEKGNLNYLDPAREPSPVSLLEIAEISDGIESLSHALSKIANGGDSLQVPTSEQYSNPTFSTYEKEGSSESIPSNGFAPSNTTNDNKIEEIVNADDEDDDYLNDYSQDLAKISLSMPSKPPNYIGDLSPTNPIHMLFQRSQRRQLLEDEENDDEEDDDDDENHDQAIEEILSKRRFFLQSTEASGSFVVSPPDSHFLTPDEVFASVPAQLLPLPQILLQVPFYRNLMHFWLEVAADHLVPAPSHIYKENPFKVILPRMAMEYPSILTTLLAFSASIRSTLVTSSGAQEIVINQLLSRSCAELLKLLRDKKKATADPALATVLLLSCFEVFQSRDFDKHRIHTLGARQIVMARTSNMASGWSTDQESSNNPGTESDISFFLMRWFVYIDIIGALSASRNWHNYLSSSGAINHPVRSVETVNAHDKDSDPKRDIDHLLGFDVKFLPYFSRIAHLIHRADSYLSSEKADPSTLPLEIIQAALEVKDRLTFAFETGEKRRQEKLDEIIDDKIRKKRESSQSTSPPNLNNLVQQDNIVRSTNKMFYSMGLINLYRRVLKVPRDSFLVQDLVANIANVGREYITNQSPADICTIFCSFTAGCETLVPKDRQYFDIKFTKLIEMGNINALKGHQIMKRCWETGEDWIDASRLLDIDIALL